MLALSCMLCACMVQAQHTGKNGAGVDTVAADSNQNAESLLFHRQQQEMVDSILRQQLLGQLKAAAGDAKRTRELLAQLRSFELEDSLRKAGLRNRIRQLKKDAHGYPVVLRYDTLFYLYTRVGSFSARERAQAVSDRIKTLYERYSFKPDSLRVIATDNGYDIQYTNDLAVMTVDQLDALWFESSPDSLAAAYRRVMISAIQEERKANSFPSWARRIGLLALIFAAAFGSIRLLNYCFRRITRATIRKKDNYATLLTFRTVRLLTPQQTVRFALGVIRALRLLAIVVVLYLALLLASGIFQATHRWTDVLLGWILAPARSAVHGITGFLPSLVRIVVIYFIFHYGIKAVGYFASEVEKGRVTLKGFHPDWAHPTFNIVRFLLYAFMIVLIFPYLPGSDSLAFKGVTVFLGLLFSLGSSSAITNIVAGMVITYMRPFKIGDRVRIGDVTGDVVEKNLLVTRIRTIKNEDITVPNSTVLSSSTVNYSANVRPEEKGLILHTTVTIGYDVPWKNMHAALLEAARRTRYVLADPEPFVLQTSLDDFFVSYQLNVHTREANKQAVIYSELHQNIQDSCNEAGIEIMSPHYAAMRDGNGTTIPEEYLPKGYQAPPFNVRNSGPDKKD